MRENKTQNDRSVHQNTHPAGRVPRQPLVSQEHTAFNLADTRSYSAHIPFRDFGFVGTLAKCTPAVVAMRPTQVATHAQLATRVCS